MPDDSLNRRISELRGEWFHEYSSVEGEADQWPLDWSRPENWTRLLEELPEDTVIRLKTGVRHDETMIGVPIRNNPRVVINHRNYTYSITIEEAVKLAWLAWFEPLSLEERKKVLNAR